MDWLNPWSDDTPLDDYRERSLAYGDDLLDDPFDEDRRRERLEEIGDDLDEGIGELATDGLLGAAAAAGGPFGKGLGKATDELGDGLKGLRRGRLRDRLLDHGDPPGHLRRPQAHHDLPGEFRERFRKKGLDIDDPRFGRWVEGGPYGSHQKWSKEFNRRWRVFLARERSREEILAFMNDMRNDPDFQ